MYGETCKGVAHAHADYRDYHANCPACQAEMEIVNEIVNEIIEEEKNAKK